MQAAFPLVLFIVVGVSAVLAVASAATMGRAYREIGRGGIWADREDGRGLDSGFPGEREAGRAPGALEAEVRAVVVALSRRRAARGLEPLDVDAEVERRLRGL